MDRLSQAVRLIADVRLGADRILEALLVAAQPHQSTKPLQSFNKEDASMHQYLQDIRAIGKLLEESGVLNESLSVEDEHDIPNFVQGSCWKSKGF